MISSSEAREAHSGTNALHWVRDAKADVHSVRSQQDQEEWNSLSFVQQLTVTSNWCVPDTCCLPSRHRSPRLSWQSALSMFTPVEPGSSGGCVWLHYAVEMKWGRGVDLIRRGWLEMKGRAFPLLAASFVFFFTLSHIPLALSSHISTPPVLNLTLVMWFICIHSSLCSSHPFLFFLSAVHVEWLLRRWTCKGHSNYCVWTALLSSVVLSRHKTFCQSSACIVSALLRQNMHHTRNTLQYWACIYWRPPKMYFEVIFLFFFSIIRLRLLKFKNDSEIDVFVNINTDITVMSVHTV